MNKKQILALACIGLTALTVPEIVTAQTAKGQRMIEVDLGKTYISKTSSTNSIDGHETSSEGWEGIVDLNPKAGYFITTNFVAGTTLLLSYQYSKEKTPANNYTLEYDYSYNGLAVGLAPFVRYYFTRNTKNRMYGELSGGMSVSLISKSTQTTHYANPTYSETYTSGADWQQIQGTALIGFNHFFNPNFAFNTSVGYNYTRFTQNSTYSSSYFSPNNTDKSKTSGTLSNLQWNLGFTVFIGAKQQSDKPKE